MTRRPRTTDPRVRSALPPVRTRRDDLLLASLATLAPPTATAVVLLLGDPHPALAAVMVLAAAALSWWTASRHVVAPLQGALVASRAEQARLAVELAGERAERELRDRVERALRDTDSEPSTLRVGLRAVAEVVPDGEVTLLLNLPDEPRIGWSVRLDGGDLEDAMPVPGTPACSALSRGATVVSSATSLEGCAHLEGTGAHLTAACVPLRAAAQLIGAVCVGTAPGEPVEDRRLALIEWIVDRIGHRTAEHRIARGPDRAERPDPLTGLPTQAALRPHLREMVRSLTPFCLAVVHVDHFDRFEHDEDADAALVWVAQALCETLRPDDVVCRLTGGGFAAVLGQCSAEQAVSVMERLREALVLLLAEQDVPFVSCSAGVVESHRATSLEEIVDLASSACDRAAAAGGNRVVVAEPDLDRA